MPEGILVVHVASPQGQPIPGVQLSTKGEDSTGSPTDVAGKTRIKLAPQTRPGNWVSLQVVGTLDGKNLIILSPWDARAQVPPFENEEENYVTVVLCKPADRAPLEYPELFAAKINAASAAKSGTERITERERRSALIQLSREYRLEPEEIDQAIHAWRKEAKAPFEKGLAALYARDLTEASQQLSKSLGERELGESQPKVLEAAFFLGQSLCEEGRYRESADAFRKAATLREDDPVILNALGLSLGQAGRYAEAEPHCKRTLEIREQALGPEHPNVATSLNSLAELYREQGKYMEAELLHKRSLEIREKVLGPEHPDVAIICQNMAALYRQTGKEDEAKRLEARAKKIRSNQ